ncbi:hypothetical protein Mnod_0620 [Methylobacterium nodulans ORS 2060]|uniref:Uncharacterized protein n=1 Tax=Methylobacterium nodulans (strain LMG 21967 / CNCM I-2342 / ORS 2060) TaxID=460265 RepID=B8IDT4_METNO|nr:hypothetical protein Mnod_0620 [Methylobacterium nodulans ORS 2060]
MNPFRWFRPQQDEPRIEPSQGARLRLARAERQHRRSSCDLIRVALDEVDRAAELMRRYQGAHGGRSRDARP